MRSLGLSLAVHAALALAIVRMREPPAEPRPASEAPVTVEIREREEPTPAPPPETAAAPAVATSEAPSRPARPASGATRPPRRAEPPPNQPRPVPAPPKALTMRDVPPLPSPADLARAVAPPPPPAPPPRSRTTERAPEPKRQREGVDLLVGVKTADDRDHMNFFGDYTPEDMNQAYEDAGFAAWDPRPVPSSEAPPAGLGKPAGHGRYRAKRLQFKAEVDADGTVHFQDVPSFQAKLLPCIYSKKELRRCAERLEFPILRGQFDLTDWAERVVGNDPYRYEKHKYLEATRPEREKMARAMLRDLLRQAVIAAPALLRELWADDSLAVVERRRLIFELWDECAEEGDADIVVAARAFRGTVLAFIRRVLPAGAPDAFSAAELEALNRARTSAQRFDPYAEP